MKLISLLGTTLLFLMISVFANASESFVPMHQYFTITKVTSCNLENQDVHVWVEGVPFSVYGDINRDIATKVDVWTTPQTPEASNIEVSFTYRVPGAAESSMQTFYVSLVTSSKGIRYSSFHSGPPYNINPHIKMEVTGTQENGYTFTYSC